MLFSKHVAMTVLFINSVPGYSCTLGDGMCKTGHKMDSFHYHGLAQDINLFYKGEYLTKTEDHQFVGDYWKSLDSMNGWGGDFKNKDGNHYSYGEGK